MGAPPPLPRDLRGFAPLWIAVLVLLAVGYWWGRESPVGGALQRWLDGRAHDLLPDLSSQWSRGPGDLLLFGVGWWALVACRWVMVVLLIFWKRWRHLAVFAGSVVLVSLVARWFPTAGREGSGVPDHPSYAAASVGVTLVGAVYGFVPPRRRKLAIGVTVALSFSLAVLWILTRQESPTEIAVGLAIGVAIPYLGFRILAPESVFPISYAHARTAHLELDERRRDALTTALREQLGVEAATIEPFGLMGSGGSTPLRITTEDGALFGKLYAMNHMRADRWYKLGRAVLYGALEDERSFNSVRRMVEYEDYALRFLRDHGVRVPEPFGFVEVTPEREYLLVTAFIEDATEILDGPVTDDIIESAVDTIRTLWDAGVAHRDVKPSNLLVSDGRVYLVDAFFCQVRPSAWRQSVDLANMLMLLALKSDTRTVYAAALRRFTPEEVAEAFAATRGVTVPGQLRTMVMGDERSLAKEFAQLAPARARIPVQRWTARRLALAGALVLGGAVGIWAAVQNLRPAGFIP